MVRRRGKKRGGSVLVLLLLCGLLGGFGTWNYQRSLEAEAREVRPYRGYSDADLETLETAFRVETDSLDARYEAAKGVKVKVRDEGFGQAQVDEFERVQRASRTKRDLGYKAAEGQATLNAIVKERALRAGQGPPWQAFLRRAFVPPA